MTRSPVQKIEDEKYRNIIMALKFKAKSKEEIPNELQALYVERDGAFVLDVDGAVEKSKVDEFRNTNVALIKESQEGSS